MPEVGQAREEAPPALAALGELLARVAEARWGEGAGLVRVECAAADLAALPEGAARLWGAVSVDGRPEGWVAAALQPEGGRGRLQSWLAGVGECLSELLGAPVRVEPSEEAPAQAKAGDGALRFSCRLDEQDAAAWLWMEPALRDRCLEELIRPADEHGAGHEAPEADWPRGGAEGGAPSAGADPFPPLPDADEAGRARGIDVLLDVPLRISVELGRTERQIRDILGLVPGSVLELDRLAGDPLDVFVNGKRIARAEVVVVDERFAIRIVEILAPEERIAPSG